MMAGVRAIGWVGAVCALAWAFGAQAQDAAVPVLEIRGGIFAHSVDRIDGSNQGYLDLSRIEDANVELLFRSPDADLFRWLGSPRPHVGATLNFGGRETMAYAGLTWSAHLFDTPVFVEGSFGGAVHGGVLTGAGLPERNLGCPALFHESASLGYQLTQEASVMLTIEHASHAGLCATQNRGMTNMGIRFGYTF